MTGSPKYSVSDRVGVLLTVVTSFNSAALGTIQSFAGYDCSKAFTVAGATGSIAAIILATARSYTKLSNDSSDLSHEPCEASWIERKIFPAQNKTPG